MPRYRKIEYRPNRDLIRVAADEAGTPAGARFLIVTGGALLFWLFVLLLFSGL